MYFVAEKIASDQDVEMDSAIVLDTSNCINKFEEHNIQWADDEDSYLSGDDDSISSEEDVGKHNKSDHVAREKSVQEIADDYTVWNTLQNLPSVNEIKDLINNNQLYELSKHKDAKTTGILIAAWLGNENAVQHLLECGALTNVADDEGRTPLHLAACSGNENCVESLIKNGASVSKWDNKMKATPLHCAASRGHLECLKLLIQAKADVNAGLSNRSPLHYAVQSLAIDCVNELLKSGAIPNTPKIFSETPLHVAAALGSSEIIKILLDHGSEVRVQCGSDKSTALHLAAEDGNAESAKLLLDAGACVSATNRKLQTPLHLAALSQSSETLELLLKRGADPNARDINGRTPLHGAIVKVSRTCDCVKLLLNAGANVNRADAFGYTPLHLAALNEFSHCILLMLNYGGDVTACTNGGISVLTFITRRTPDVIPKYIEKFDASIKLNDHELGDVDCELKLDFRILVPTTAKGETELLLNFIEVGHREVLKHPLCETFLFLKWRRIRKFFLFSLFYHCIFALLFTEYIVKVFLRDCKSTRGNYKKDTCIVEPYVNYMGYILIVLNLVLMGKELFQIAHSWRTYIKQWENWLQWAIIISIFCCVCPTNIADIRKNFHAWQHHVAAVGIFLTWVELMMIVGRFPIFGLYVQMFTTVAVNFSKFLAAYLCLLIAFSLSFSVLFPNYPAYKNVWLSFIKTIMMMSGELEYEDIYHGDFAVVYPGTAHIIFLAFVVLVTVILTNLMVGLAVNDIQGLQQSAGLDRLVRQAELVAHLESILFSRLLRWLPRRLLASFYRHALLLKSQYQWALYIKPNDPREERIPRNLIKNIYQLVAQSKPKKKKRSTKKSYRLGAENIEYNSPAVSRMNSDSNSVDNNCNYNYSKINKRSLNFNE